MQIMQQSPRLPFAGQPQKQVRPNAPAFPERSAPTADRLTFSHPAAKPADSVRFSGGGWYNHFMQPGEVQGHLLKGHDLEETDEFGDTVLIMAADCNTHDVVELLLNEGANVNHQNEKGDTALINTAPRGRMDMAKRLIKGGAALDIQNKAGRTALMEAAHHGQYHLAQELLESGANPALKDKAGKTAENLAQEAGQDFLAAMLYYTSDEAKKTMAEACRKGNLDQVNRAIQHGMPVDVMMDGQTPLMIAAERGHMGLLNTLLMEDADPRRVGQDGNTAVIHAAKSGQHDPLLSLLTHVDANHVNHRDKWGNTALNWAVRRGHHDITETLLRRKANVRNANAQGNTPLAMAARNGDEKMVKLILQYGPDLNHANMQGNTPIMQAAKKGHGHIVELLREQGADDTIRNQDGKTADMLLAEASDRKKPSEPAKAPPIMVNHSSQTASEPEKVMVSRHTQTEPEISSSDQPSEREDQPAEPPAQAQPAPQRAGWGGWIKKGLVGLLLATAGKPLLQYGYNAATGNTPFLKAVRSGDVKQAEKLVADGENPYQTDIWGWSGKDYAARAGHAQMIQTMKNVRAQQVEALVQRAGANDANAVHKLLAQGLDINQPNAAGITPLGQAARTGRHKMIDFLVDQGVDVNKRFGPDENTALIEAVKHKRMDAIKVLINAKADVNQTNKKGWTALMHAASNGHAEAVTALAQAGANINQVNKDSWTALMIAASHGHPKAIKALAQAGANINQVNKSGMTALMYAASQGHLEATKVLLAHNANPLMKDNVGKTVLGYALESGNRDLFRLLEEVQKKKSGW